MALTVAVLDDEKDILDLVCLHLTKAGFRVEAFADPVSFYRYLEKSVPDLIVLDLMLPEVDGLDICRKLKSVPKLAGIPIVMLTAKNGETDKIVGLELGADDYITKPFSVRELAARVKAVLRRKQAREEPPVLKAGEGLEIDLERHEVRLLGEPVEITATEFGILRQLASRPGRVYTRDEILDYLWGHEKAVVDRTVDVHIKNLRKKLGTAGFLIKNVRGVGYKLET